MLSGSRGLKVTAVLVKGWGTFPLGVGVSVCGREHRVLTDVPASPQAWGILRVFVGTYVCACVCTRVRASLCAWRLLVCVHVCAFV